MSNAQPNKREGSCPLAKRTKRSSNLRQVRGLISATLCERPSSIPKARLRGNKAKGISYEKLVGKDLKREFGERVFLDQWIGFFDQGGLGYACVDGFVVGEDVVLLTESKLTQTERAWKQMELKYVPLLMHIYQRPIVTLQICKNLVKRLEPGERRTPRRLFENPERGRFTHHWLGRI